MADALWIDEDYIKANSVISENTDVKVITSNIVAVADEYIKPLLGSDLFDVVEAEINAQVFSTRITNLLVELKKVILNYALAECAPDFAYRWENKGIMKKKSENSDYVDADELKTVQERFYHRAKIYEGRCRRFLIQNNTTYPEYYNGNTDIDELQPNNLSIRSGLYLGTDNDKDCEYRKRNV